MNSLSPCHKLRQTAFALPLVLFAVVLLSAIVVVLLSKTASSRRDASGSASIARVEQTVSTVTQTISGLLREEIRAAAETPLTLSDGSKVYRPRLNESLLPEESGVTNVPPVVKVTRENTPFWTGGVPNSVSAPAYLYGGPTTSPAMNGRFIPKERWDLPGLVSGGLPATFTPPDWVLLSRSGPLDATAANTPVGELASSGAANAQFVTGRFAYIVYDVSGLPDVNAWGAPASIPSPFADERGFRQSPHFVALEALGFTAEQAQQLAMWRNAASVQGAGLDPTRYLDYVQDSAEPSGNLTLEAGDNRWFGRMDLIRFAKAHDMANLLPLLGTFSRERTSPSALPPAVTLANPDLASVRPEGEPLRRFPLSRLAILTKPVLSLTADDNQKIKDWFGLELEPGSTDERKTWIYRQTATTIEPLASASASRQPDFLELLKAGILEDSLGTASGDAALRVDVPDSNKGNQIAQIAANILDQYDEDSFPTTLVFNGYRFYGIEDLPYFSEVFMRFWGENPQTKPYAKLFFELWNPHAPNVATGAGPTAIRMRVNADAMTRVWNQGGVYTYRWNPQTSINELVGPYGLQDTGWVPLTGTIQIGPLAQYREPKVIRNAGGGLFDTQLGANAIDLTVPDPEINADRNPNWQLPQYWGYNALEWDRVQFLLEYQSGGNWYPYAVWGGPQVHVSPESGLHGFGTLSRWFWVRHEIPGDPAGAAPGIQFLNGWRSDPWNANAPLNSVMSWSKVDPRTNRWGATYSEFHPGNSPEGRYMRVDASMWSAPTAIQGASHDYPRFFAATRTQGQFDVRGSRPGYLALNLTSVPPFATDGSPDGMPRAGFVSRPADAYLGEAAGSVNPMEAGNVAARPVILNRAFRSVAELGYVARDMPWKTLDFFNGTSADAALLDLFCISENEAGLRAGAVDLNRASATTLAAAMSGVRVREADPTSLLPKSSADQLAAYFQNQVSTPAKQAGSIADIVGLLATTQVNAARPAIKTEREAPVRALAQLGGARTWTFLIDMFVQSGKLSPQATDVGDFVVEGERRYWVHLAIDRFTGEIIETQYEPIYE